MSAPMDKFELGEIAIANDWRRWPECNGQDVTIVGDLCNRKNLHAGGYGVSYLVETQDGRRCTVRTQQLRKKRPPRHWASDEQRRVVKWGDCVWQPQKVNS